VPDPKRPAAGTPTKVRVRNPEGREPLSRAIDLPFA